MSPARSHDRHITALAPSLSRVDSSGFLAAASTTSFGSNSGYTTTGTPSSSTLERLGSNSSTMNNSNNNAFERDFNGYNSRGYPYGHLRDHSHAMGNERYRSPYTSVPPQLAAFSPTLAPPLQTQQMQSPSHSINDANSVNTYTPFVFDSPFPVIQQQQPFAGAAASLSQGPQYSNNAIGGQVVNTPIDFDSLFGYTATNVQQQSSQQHPDHQGSSGTAEEESGGLIGAPLPINYWEDADFVDRIMTGFQDVRANEQMNMNAKDSENNGNSSNSASAENPSMQQHLAPVGFRIPGQAATPSGPMISNTPVPSTISTKNNSITIPVKPSSTNISPTFSHAQEEDTNMTMMSGSQSQTGSMPHSPRSVHSDSRSKSRPVSSASSSQIQPSTPASTPGALPMSTANAGDSSADTATGPPANATNSSSAQPVNTTMADFAPQPAIDPILQATSTGSLHKAAANRNKIAPSLKELEMGPPPNLVGNQKEWSIPSTINETMKHMSNARHVELLKHCERAFSVL